MVVGKDKSFGRDDFTGATSSENTYRILQRDTVGVVDVIGLQLQTLFLHQVDRVLLL